MFLEYLRASKKKIDKDFSSSSRRKMLSPIIYSQYKKTIPIARKYISGKLIDIGCGFSPYRKLLSDITTKYDGVDRFPYNNLVTYIADVQSLKNIPDNAYNSSICFEVLEHIPCPLNVINEIHRILEPNSYLILTVPLLSQLHEEPSDYFRFTKYGLFEMFSTNQFEIIELHKKAGLFSFLGHQLSFLIISLFWPIPIIKELILYLNYLLITLPCYYLDQLTDKKGVYAQGYILVAKNLP